MSFLTPEWASAVRAKAIAPEFSQARRALDDRVASYRASLPPLPDRQAGYYHDFFCPDHAVQLRFDPASPHRHVCPIDGAAFAGEPFDSAWRWSVNDVLSDAALRLAFRAFLHEDAIASSGERHADLEGDRRRARDILAGYAARYREIAPAPRPHPNHPGVVTWSGLDESAWIIRLAWAHALLGESLAASDDRAIRDDLLRPAADHLLRVRWPEVHNVTTWNNAALVTLAIALGDARLLDAAVDGPLGQRAQLEHGVRADSFWWEGSLSYHFYTLAALVWTARSLRAGGHTFAQDEVLRGMFAAPISLAFPDLTLPAIHDCWYAIGLEGEVGHGIPDAAGFYETAFGWYGDPSFAWVVQRNAARRPRTSFEALLDGATTIPTAQEPAFVSFHAAPSGLALLRSDDPRREQTYLLLKAGPDARDHGHPDQLSIQLFARGSRLTPDLGTPGYGIGLNDTWYRQTASHGTVLLDGRSQPQASGRITHVRETGDFALVGGSVSWDAGDYAGVEMRRTILWRNTYFLDVVHVECAVSRQIDWVYHNLGALIEAPSGEPVEQGLAGECGYEHVADVARSGLEEAARLRWHAADMFLDVYVPPLPSGVLVTGTAPANPASQRLSVAIRRCTARRVRFVALFAPCGSGDEPPVREVAWTASDDHVTTVAVTTPSGVERWEMGAEPLFSRLART